jgi:hypothetical protein
MRLVPLLLLACAPDPGEPSADHAVAADTAEPLPGHNECRAEALSTETCLAVVEADGRYPTTAEDRSYTDPVADDPRATDPELAWLRDDLRRCACACCHMGSVGGPGAYFWDLEWEPVWIDSASTWTIGVLLGETGEGNQTLPLGDRARASAILEAERERRRAAARGGD